MKRGKTKKNFPENAQSWIYNNNYMTNIIFLRGGVNWHCGVVLFSVEHFCLYGQAWAEIACDQQL